MAKYRRTDAKKKPKHIKKFTEYEDRNDTLKAMGLGTYAEYLKSAMWERIRDSVMQDGPLCVCCNSKKATQVHHLSYDYSVLVGEDISKLAPVCGACHHRAEFSGKKKNDLATANKYILSGGKEYPADWAVVKPNPKKKKKQKAKNQNQQNPPDVINITAKIDRSTYNKVRKVCEREGIKFEKAINMMLFTYHIEGWDG